ncbi:hypothetical protein IKF21_02810 [Candidatus Saccharibacteria bacterium]|nr:hypothetical protein [Candidatus Saccharibacteria bacterium]
MKKILKIVLPILMVGVIAVAGITGGFDASALTLEEGAQAARCDGCPSDLFGDNGVFKRITNTILYIAGVVAVVMLIIGGIKYVVSGGDSKKVTDAKNTVLYAIIGLIICFLAFAIVNFVISALPSSGGEQNNQNQNQNSSLMIETA